MVIREYGSENPRHLVFFQGSCEPWQEFRPAAEGLAGGFHVMLVTPDGHDPEEHNDFVSVEKTVDDTVQWLRERAIDHLDAIYGLSFGGGMVARFLTTQDIPVYYITADVLLKLARSSVRLMEMAFPPARFARNPENAKREYEQIQRYLKGYSNRTIWNIFWSANNYAVPKTAPKLDTQIQFWVGTDEWGSRFRDLKWIKQYLPQIEVVKIPNMMHGEFVMMHPEAFAEKALAFLG